MQVPCPKCNGLLVPEDTQADIGNAVVPEKVESRTRQVELE